MKKILILTALICFADVSFAQKKEDPKDSEKVQNLEEVVITALGVKREKKSLGYSVQEVSGKSLNTATTVSPLSALSGQVSGLNVSSTGSGPGGSVKVLIRGAKSMTGNNEPLYVVDGVPMNNDSATTAAAGGGFDYGNAANNINPDDIESISVLKGGAAAALYGSRGANGVIMITTKQGKKGSKFDVNFNSSITFSNPITYPKLQNEYSQGSKGQLALGDVVSWGAKMQGQDYVDFLNNPKKLVQNNENPFKDFFKTGINFNNSVAITKGLEKGSIYFSLSNLKNEGITPNEKFNKTNINLRVNHELNDYINFEAKANVIVQEANNRPNLLDTPDNPMYALYYTPRSVTLNQLKNYSTPTGYPVVYNRDYTTDSNGNVYTRNGDNQFKFSSAPYTQNPYWASNLNTNNDSRDRFIGYAKMDFNLLKIFPSIKLDKFSLMIRGGADYLNDNRQNQAYTNTYYKPSGLAKLTVFKGSSLETNADFLFTGLKQFSSFGASASFGGNIRHNKNDQTTSNSDGGIIEKSFPYVINNFNNVQTTQNIDEKEVQSLYAMLSLDYKKMLYLDLTARNDWYSTINPDSWSLLYPSASLSWIVSETFNISDKINYLKLRTSYAEVGSDLPPGQLRDYYTISSNQYQGLPYGNISSTKNNPNIVPEITRSLEFGLESKMFKNRFGLDFAYYNSGTRNQIFIAPESPSSGYNFSRVNAGLITNSGFEIGLKGTPIKTKDLNLNLIFNVSRNYSKVEELKDGINVLTIQNGSVQGKQIASIDIRRDEIPGLLVGKAYDRDANGNILLDTNNLPMIKQANGKDYSQNILGNVLPKWIAGFGLNIEYKNVFLDAFIDSKFGNKMYSYSNNIGNKNGILESTLDGRDNPDGKMISGSKNGVVGDYYVNPQAYFDRLSDITEAYVYDASFIRLQRFSLGYNFKRESIKVLGLKNLSMSLVGSNLAYLMKKTPNTTPNSAFTSGTFGGIELLAYPELKNIGFNISATF
jgi:TonB-linked SusC/RagA family outer membrane protein